MTLVALTQHYLDSILASVNWRAKELVVTEKERQTINAEFDRLIDGGELDEIMGGQSQSTRYADPELRKLAISMTSPDRKSKRVRWLLSEVLELRRQRIEAARAKAEDVQQRVIEQNTRRRQRRMVT